MGLKPRVFNDSSIGDSPFYIPCFEAWYVPSQSVDASCYFKSMDGHRTPCVHVVSLKQGRAKDLL